MREPVFGATTPDGRWTVRVHQAAPPEGKTGEWYYATVTLDGMVLTESLTTDDTEKLIRWTRKQMEEAMRWSV
jgi:hypothetical protein